MSHGICIIALGSQLYGSCAYNLALSIKAEDKQIKIAVLHNLTSIEHLTSEERQVFDLLKVVPDEYFMVDGTPQYQRAKLCADILSPFDYTMVMDADSIFMPDKKASWLLGECMHRDFVIDCNGYYDIKTNREEIGRSYTFWGDLKAITKYYSLKGRIPQTISGFYAFKKTPEVIEIFSMARRIYDDPKAPAMRWANGKPDEFCFNVALSLIDEIPQKQYTFYFDKVNGTQKPEDVYLNYWGIAIGGNRVSEWIVRLYNQLIDKFSLRMKRTSRHYHKHKRDVLEERINF